MKEEDEYLDPEELEKAQRVAFLISGFIHKTLSPGEKDELDAWVSTSEHNVQLFEELTDEKNLGKALDWHKHINTEKALKLVKKKIKLSVRKKPLPNISSWMLAAAILVFTIAGITYFLMNKNEKPVQESARQSPLKNDAPPGTGKAVLLLSDGRQIFLDKALDGNIAVQGNTQIVKKDSMLSYAGTSQMGIRLQPVYNTLTVPNGGIFRLTLPDGSLVWLNSASSLHFPTAFTGHERKVELTGEGYFEIAKDPSKPFLVRVNNLTVEVLGTHFNINAYRDFGDIKTTLLEGSVRLMIPGSSKTIDPGQQAVWGADGIRVVNADLQEATGWKDGNFVFHQREMSSVIKDLQRWYNVNMEYRAGTLSHLNATVPRNLPLSKLIHYLEATGAVHFKWQKEKWFVE